MNIKYRNSIKLFNFSKNIIYVIFLIVILYYCYYRNKNKDE